jgi:hypothetical protein
MVLKLNQKILECIERDDRDKADEYKECLKECLASFSLSKRHQNDMSPGLATLSKHPSSSISANNSGLETRISLQDTVNRLPVVNTARVSETRSQTSANKTNRWTKRQEWMLVKGDVRLSSIGVTKLEEIKEMFKPDLDDFTNNGLCSKLYQLKSKNPARYKLYAKAIRFEDIM